MHFDKIQGFYYKYEKRIIYLTLLFFLLLRLFYVFEFGNFDKSTFSDASGYNEYAKTILSDSSWLKRTDFIASWREPGYPLFVACIYFLWGEESFLAVYLVQAFLSSLMLLIIYKTANLVVNSKAVAYLSLLWSGFYIFYLRWIGELLRETLVYFLYALFFYLLFKLLKNKSVKIKNILFISIIYTLLIHTDGRYLFYAPFLIILFLIYLRPIWLALKNYIIFGLLVVVFTVPWSIRNYITYGDLIVVSYYTLNLTGSELSSRNELFDTSEIKEAKTSLHFGSFNQNYPSEIERDSIIAGFNPRNRSNSELLAIRKGKRATTSFLGRKAYYLKKMWAPFNTGGYYAPFPMAYYEDGYSVSHNIISICQYGILIPFALFSIIFGIAKRKKWIWLLIIPIFIHMLLHLLTFGIERYRHPVDAFIIILAMNSVVYLVNLTFHHTHLSISNKT